MTPLKRFSPKQVVAMSLDLDSFEPGPVEAFSFTLGEGVEILKEIKTAKEHGGRLKWQNREGNLYLFPSLASVKEWFTALTGRKPDLIRGDGEGNGFIVIRREIDHMHELPMLVVQVASA